MYVYVYTITYDGELQKYCRMSPKYDDPQTAVLHCIAQYMEMYAEDFGCDFSDAIVNINKDSGELRLTDWDGEDARMYFSTDGAAWEQHK